MPLLDFRQNKWNRYIPPFHFNAYIHWFRPSTSEITFLHCSPELELYRESLQKSSKARCGAPNNCIDTRFPDPQLQILHFWPPLIEQAPSWNLLKCGEIWWNQLQLLSPRHLIPANLHWFGPSTNDFTFVFAPHPQQHPAGIATFSFKPQL